MDIDKIAMLRTIKNKYHFQDYGSEMPTCQILAKKLWIKDQG